LEKQLELIEKGKHRNGQLAKNIVLLSLYNFYEGQKEKTQQMVQKMVDNDYPAGHYKMFCYLLEKGEPLEDCLVYLERSSDLDFPPAMFRRAMFLSMEGEKHVPESIKLIKKGAVIGDANCQFQLGLLFHHGFEDQPSDPKKAIFWYKKAEEQGHAKASNNIGACYFQGIGMVGDNQKAMNYFQKGCLNDCPESFHGCGLIYEDQGDYESAASNYIHATRLGHPGASFRWGLLLLTHRIELSYTAERRLKDGITLIKGACQAGHPEAIQYLVGLKKEIDKIDLENPEKDPPNVAPILKAC
jgi:TPR repeat protein